MTKAAAGYILQDEKELRTMVGINNIDDNTVISEKVLLKMYNSMDFNGEHNCNGLTDEKLSQALDRIIKTGDF